MLKWLAHKFEQRRRSLQERLENSLQSTPTRQEPVEPADWLKSGNALLDKGDLSEAGRCYQNAIDLSPDNVGALVNLGFVKSELKLHKEASLPLERAVSLDPNNSDAWYVLGGIREQDKDLSSAALAFRKVIKLRPDFELAYRDLCRVVLQNGELESAKSTILKGLELNPACADFHFYLGNVHFIEADYDAATACFGKTLSIQPDYAQAYLNQGKIFEKQEQLDAALIQYQKALALQEDNAEIHSSLGNLYLLRGQVPDAMTSYRRAVSLEPQQSEVQLNMGSALIAGGSFGAAVEHCKKAIELKPDDAMAHNIMGIALYELGQTQQALAAFSQALTFNPCLMSALCNMGSSRLSEARLDDAIDYYRQALSVEPDNKAANSNLLFALNYHSELPATEIYAAYQHFDEAVGLPLQTFWTPFANVRSTDRRLRIGYVSPDFRQHSVMRFLEPVLARHDAKSFEVYAYAEVTREDAATKRAKSMVACWRSTVGLSDEAVARMIRDDQIDVLIDVAGHTDGNRLRVFARKPAPVSVSWMGYGYTTGLSAIDYYLTDGVTAPPGSENLFAEDPWRMQRPPYVYRPDPSMGVEGSLPASTAGYITFGTLSRPVRINHRVVRVWAEILNRVHKSRLIVDSKSYADAPTRDALIMQFEALGVERQRLQIGHHSPPWDLLRTIDISLDCFPHNSGTTLFESLYMGVPYVTLAGRPSVGRLGASILHGLGHPEWIAYSEGDYVEVAVKLAQNRDNLARLRASLRREMQESCLMDEAGFARDIENAYRDMFKAWLQRVSSASDGGDSVNLSSRPTEQL